MDFSNKIIELRKFHQYTQQYVAELLDVSKSTYIKYERGERKPKYETLFKLSNIYKVSIDYLLGKEENLRKNSYVKQNISNLLNLISDTKFIDDMQKKYPGFITVLEQLSELTNEIYNTDNYYIIDIIYLATTISYDLINVHSLYEYLFNICNTLTPNVTEALYKSGIIVENSKFLLNKYISNLQDVDYYNNKIACFKKYIEHSNDREEPFLL